MSKDNTILLRVIAFQEADKFYAICLETNIVVRDNSLNGAMQKMLDALTSYFRTFKEQEVLENKHVRKAPFKYYVSWYLNPILRKLFKIINSTENIEYNPHSKHLQVA